MSLDLLALMHELDVWPSYASSTYAEWVQGNIRRTNMPRMSLGHAIPQGLDPATHGWRWTGSRWLRLGVADEIVRLIS